MLHSYLAVLRSICYRKRSATAWNSLLFSYETKARSCNCYQVDGADFNVDVFKVGVANISCTLCMQTHHTKICPCYVIPSEARFLLVLSLDCMAYTLC